MKKLILLTILLMLLTGCTKKERLSTVDTVSYENGGLTIMFMDGLVIKTNHYDEGIEKGEEVIVRHKSNGDIIIKKK